MEKRDNKILKRFYKQRSEIIQEIPNFWSTVVRIHLPNFLPYFMLDIVSPCF
ncbi:hypothetical protein MKW92_027669 [Papaver armeniacum]|nr:hypothetical protein MKW92_027669 [Papaver armeniacum]